jgi:hypothetical protein
MQAIVSSLLNSFLPASCLSYPVINLRWRLVLLYKLSSKLTLARAALYTSIAYSY